MGNHLKTFITNQYQELFMSIAGTHVEEVLECVPTRVTQQMNENLGVAFTQEEVWEALKEMGELKAPGDDFMPVLFYKKFWSMVGEKVKEVLAILNGADMPEGWNETVIVLIPKISSPEKLKDLRPISLCSVQNYFEGASKQVETGAARDHFTVPECLCARQVDY